MVYNGYYKVMSNIPKMGQLPTPADAKHFPKFSPVPAVPPAPSGCDPSAGTGRSDVQRRWPADRRLEIVNGTHDSLPVN